MSEKLEPWFIDGLVDAEMDIRRNAIAKLPAPMQDRVTERIENSLESAILGINSFGIGQPGIGVQLSQLDTLFNNNRWFLISNYRQLLSESYVEIGLLQNVIDVPVDDAFRGGITLKTMQLSEDEIQDLQAEIEREGDLLEVKQANKWNRLFGGAAVLIMTDQDPASPFDPASLNENEPYELRAIDMWELYYDKQNVEGYDAAIQDYQEELYSYYGKKIHHTRVMKMKGLNAPSFVRPRLRGWGFSIVESLVRSINQYLKASDLSFEVLDEFKLDIFKIKGLSATLLKQGGEAKIRQRVAIANAQKNYQNALTMDAEDDYEQKQLSWSGLADAMREIRAQVAADMRMTMIKLFGQGAASGLNASSEDEIEVYNSMVESQVRDKSKYEVLRAYELRCQRKFGFIPDDMTVEFKPLRVLSAEQEETVKEKKFNRVMTARTAGEISSLEFREAVNKDQLMPIQLDTSDQTLKLVEDEQTEKLEADQDLEGETSSEDDASDEGEGKADEKENPSGANRPTSEKMKLNWMNKLFGGKRK